jgi:hypothetical protein
VERIFLDEPSGAIKSFGQRFEDVVGKTVHAYLGVPNTGGLRSV